VFQNENKVVQNMVQKKVNNEKKSGTKKKSYS
jgi:hypothetical protein